MAIIVGDDTPQTLTGTAGDDFIAALGGADTVIGSSGTDYITAGSGADTIRGGDGADTIFGEDGDDIIYGHSEADLAQQSGVINATQVASGMSGVVYLSAAPGDTDDVYVVRKDESVIVRLNPDTGAQATFLDIPNAQISSGGESGLLGLAFHPEYAANGLFYVFLTNAAGNLEVREYARSTGDPNIANPDSGRVLLTIPHPTNSNHNGGQINFGPDGYLYISVGDGGGANDPNNNSQNRDLLLGKILRIDVNGDDFAADASRNYAIPDDNPFVGVAGADEVWAYGLRNPWRFSFDSETGNLYIADVGQGQREEIDFRAASAASGANFGWRIMEGSLPYLSGPPGSPPAGDPSLINPVFEYGRDVGAAITGGYVYHGPTPGMQGAYVFADFVTNRMFSLRMVDGVAVDEIDHTAQIRSPSGAIDQVSSFGTDTQGRLYVMSLSGEVYRLDFTTAAGDGADILIGGAGNDSIYGGAGNDWIVGDDGDDILSGGIGINVLRGEAGTDLVSYAGSSDNLWVDMRAGVYSATGIWDSYVSIEGVIGGSGADTVFGTTAGGDTLQGGGGADQLIGLGGDDSLRGDDGNDYLDGGDGIDRLLGGLGVDVLLGGAGADRLEGGAGVDYYTGGAGADQFVFGAAGQQDWDVVTNFNAAEDRISLGGAVFSGFTTADLDGDGAADDTLLGYAGGNVAMLNASGLSLEGWNGLIGGG